MYILCMCQVFGSGSNSTYTVSIMPAVEPGTHGTIFFLESTQKIVQTSVRAFVCKGAIGLHSKFQNMITLHHHVFPLNL